jgi:hypothetical protein
VLKVEKMDEHGIRCGCGEEFSSLNGMRKHLATKEALSEIRRIGGEKFYLVHFDWETGPYSENLKEIADQHNIEFHPCNATEIAKKALIHTINGYENHKPNK